MISAWLGATDGGTWWSREDREPHLSASTMKLPLAVAAHRLHERGRLDLDAPVDVHDDFDSAVAGERFTLAQDDDGDLATWAERGEQVALRELLRRSLCDSGNLAANLVLERVGLDEVADVVEEAGCSPRTDIVRGIGDLPARRAGLENIVTARDLGLVLCGIAEHHLAGAAACQAIEDDLASRTLREGIPAGLPTGVLVVGKPGWISGVSHDVALVRPDAHPPFVLSVLTRHGAAADDGWGLVARTATRAWDALEQRVGHPLHVGS